jgi:hypothetical protein
MPCPRRAVRGDVKHRKTMQQALARAIPLSRNYGLGAVDGCAAGGNTTGRDTGLSLSFTMNTRNFAGSVALAFADWRWMSSGLSVNVWPGPSVIGS